MQSVLLDTPAGITARLGLGPEAPRARPQAPARAGDRRGAAGRRAEGGPRRARGARGVRLPHPAHRRGRRGGAAAGDPQRRASAPRRSSRSPIPRCALGLDLRDAHPDEPTLHRDAPPLAPVRRDDIGKLHRALDAGPGGARRRRSRMRVSQPTTCGSTPRSPRGGSPTGRCYYQLADLSRDSWVITLAYPAGRLTRRALPPLRDQVISPGQDGSGQNVRPRASPDRRRPSGGHGCLGPRHPRQLLDELGQRRFSSASHTRALPSDGARQSPRGDSEPAGDTFGPFGIADRLNCANAK